MLSNYRIACFSLVILHAVSLGIAVVSAADKQAWSEERFLIRVERESRDDLSRLLSAGIPVVMEMRASLFLEGGPKHLRWLDDRGYDASILHGDPASSDYLVVGLRPDSSLNTLRAIGKVLHREENWMLVRVPRGAPIEAVAAEKVFVTRMPHEPLQPPKSRERPSGSRTADLTDPDPLVQAIVDQVLPSSIDQLWADLTSNSPTGTRYSTHQGCFDATAYCHDWHDGLGLSVEYQGWSASHAPNVIATQPGALYPDDVYIVIGHLDDLPTSPPAPGADDNASGSVTVLEAARVMSCYALESTVKYLNVTGEESGLLGSEAYADQAWISDENILGVINMDMSGWEGDGIPGPENLDINYNSASEWLALLFADCAERYDTGLAVDAFYCPSLSVSDHYPFWQKGWSAICGITDNEGYCGHGGHYPYYHTSSDTIANCGDPTFFYSAVKTSVATLAEMARPFRIRTDRSSYACASGIGVLVGDRDLDTDPELPETVVVEAWSDSEPTPELITLDERSIQSMLFEGIVPTSMGPPVAGDGEVSVVPGDVVTLRYVDALDCDGATGVAYTSTAQIDCTAPLISNVAVNATTGSRATIIWDTDEPSDSLVTYGAGAPGAATSTAALVTSHSVTLDHLDECTGYAFFVTSTDEAGNIATDDNAGAFYGFSTGVNSEPEYGSIDTPIPIEDNTTHTSMLVVSDDKPVLEATVRIDITHTYTGDLDVTLISPNGTRVLLVADEGSGGDNFTETVFDDDATASITTGSAPFTGTFQPEQPLAAVVGQSSLGAWTLEVVDDAGGDTGSLDHWALTLTYPARACGPSATYRQHALEADSCPAGGGDENGSWDAGEQIQFSLTVENDGTDPLTGVTAVVTPLTAGVFMIDRAADFADIPEGEMADSLAPHCAARLPGNLVCGQELAFEVAIDANQGSWIQTLTQIAGVVVPGGDAVAWAEDFETGNFPAGWSVLDANGDGNTWYPDDATDPASCSNTDPSPPIAGTWAAVDSDCTGSGVPMDESLISEVIDLTGLTEATLEFDHYFNWLGPEKADVDVRSTLTGGLWVNVARWVSDTANPEHAAIDITTLAAGADDVQFRWHYHDAEYEWFWYVDNVAVTYPSAAGCVMPVCPPGPTGPPPIPDGDSGTQPLLARRLLDDGSEIEVRWDDRCLPTNANLLHGPLDQVSSYLIGGSICAISTVEVWTGVPSGSLWFLLVSDDGAGAESSWGRGAWGERNGLAPSGTCGGLTKDVTGTCP